MPRIWIDVLFEHLWKHTYLVKALLLVPGLYYLGNIPGEEASVKEDEGDSYRVSVSYYRHGISHVWGGGRRSNSSNCRRTSPAGRLQGTHGRKTSDGDSDSNRVFFFLSRRCMHIHYHRDTSMDEWAIVPEVSSAAFWGGSLVCPRKALGQIV